MSFAEPQPPLFGVLALILVASIATCSQLQGVGPQFEKRPGIVPIPDEKCLLRCDKACDECLDRAGNGEGNIEDALTLCEIDKGQCYEWC